MHLRYQGNLHGPNLSLWFIFLRIENSSLVVSLTLDRLHILWRHVAIVSNVSEVRPKASVGFSATLVARFDSQLFLKTKFNHVVVDSTVFVD
jgi:hypothetical protein